MSGIDISARSWIPAPKSPPSMPQYYTLPHGVPLYWRDETSGQLTGAMSALINHLADRRQAEPSEKQLRLVIDYLVYVINAPAWQDGGTGVLVALRDQAPQLKTVEHIADWIELASEIGLDPL